MTALYWSGVYFFVPRNIMCSKKCANPDLPGSISLREPVWTGIWTETMFGNPVGTTMTLRPLGRVVSVALKGRMSDGEAVAADFVAAFRALDCAARRPGRRATAASERNRRIGRAGWAGGRMPGGTPGSIEYTLRTVSHQW
jgi:hypothetical protein